MVNYKQFVKDYNDMNMTAHEVRRKNQLNSKQYSKIRKKAIKKGDIEPVRHMNTTNAKFYTTTNQGTCIVQKQYAGDSVYVGEFPNEETAIQVVNMCKSVNWEVSLIENEIKPLKLIKCKNYTCINGYWFIQKTVNGKMTTYCTFKKSSVDEETVKEIVDKLREYDWNINYTDKVLEEVLDK